MGSTLNIFTHFPKVGGVSITNALKEVGKVQVFSDFVIDKEIYEDTDFVIGHLGFGAHEAVYPGHHERVRYLGMVRNPVGRVWSHYRYLQRQQRIEEDVTLLDFLDKDTAMSDNLQVRMLNGLPWYEWRVARRHMTNEDLRQAKYNVSQFYDWIGVTEHFNASLARLSLHLQVDLAKHHDNRAPAGVPMTEEERKAVFERNRLDYELWEWVKFAYGYP